MSAEGVHIAQSKIEPFASLPVPANFKEVQSFLGSCNWFRNFIESFAVISALFTTLTRKDTPWQWTSLEHSSFQSLKDRITSAPTLRHFNPALPTIVYTDASEFFIGG